MNEYNDENEIVIRTGIQAGDDSGLLGSGGGKSDDGGGYMGSGGRQIIGSGA